jgi:hypothetical protein
VLLIPAMPTPLLPKDPTASTILANLNELLCFASVCIPPGSLFDPRANLNEQEREECFDDYDEEG